MTTPAMTEATYHSGARANAAPGIHDSTMPPLAVLLALDTQIDGEPSPEALDDQMWHRMVAADTYSASYADGGRDLWVTVTATSFDSEDLDADDFDDETLSDEIEYEL